MLFSSVCVSLVVFCSAFTCSKSLIEKLEQRVKYVKKITIKAIEEHQRRHWRRSGVSTVNFEDILHFVLLL